MSDKVYVGRNAVSAEISPVLDAYSRVVLIVGTDGNGNQIVYESGDSGGQTLEIENPWGTQQIADDILDRIRGYAYQPFTATGAIVDPAAELGDGVTVNGIYSVLAAQDIAFGSLMASDISAPLEEEIDHEYPYESGENRKIERKIAKNRTSLTVQNGLIRAEVARATEAEGELSSQISVTADRILSTVSASGTWYLGNYQTDVYGYGAPDEDELEPSEYAGKYYLDQSNGKLYQSNGSEWELVTSLDSVQSQISQQATEISTKITSSQAQTQIRQTLNNITLSVESGSNGSSVSIKGTGIDVSSDQVDLHVKSVNVDGEITAGKLKAYGENTNQRSEMTATGLNVYNSDNAQKIGLGWKSGSTEYPYLMLGQGTGSSASGAGLVQKLGAGIWIGDAVIADAGGNYPGNASSVQNISGSYGQATGLFVDFIHDAIYKYNNGVPTELGEAVFG